MGLSITQDEFKLLRDLIEKECGIEVKDEKVYLIENRLTRLVIENGCESFGEFYLKAKTSPDKSIRTKIVDAITTNETLWFRDEIPFQIMRDKLLPEFARQLQSGEKKELRIWSAACSTGQEPYSLAMLITELSRESGAYAGLKEKTSILATDISNSALLLAKSARYDTIAMSRGMLPQFQERYFEEQGRVCLLKEEIKSMVTFEQFNLQNSLIPLGRFDIVMLRNVAIYFAHEFKIQLFKKIARVLNPEGYLFLGTSEILSGYSTDYQQQEHGRGLYYQVKAMERESL